MTDDEISLLEEQFLICQNYFEYGSGASTKRAVHFENISSIVSVESDSSFFEQEVATDDAVAEAISESRLKFMPVDIGPTKNWGHPTDRSSISKWPNYAKAIQGFSENWDLVLIDGRFRVACLAAALIQSPGANILVHDFWRRKRYRVMLDYCDVIKTADQLVLLTKKENKSAQDLSQLLAKYQTRPSDKTLFLHLQARLGIKV